MSIFWFALFILLLIIEFVTVNLVTLWFAVGAVAAMICATFTESIIIQLGVFIFVSLLSILIMKPMVKKFMHSPITPTNSDRFIGKIGEVTKEINANNYGEIKILGTVWTAVADSKITVGTKVKVKEIDGVKLIVEKKEDE